MREVTNHVDQVKGALLEPGYLSLNDRVSTFLQLPLDVAESDGQGGQLLVHIVVQIARDARTFGLLGRNQLPHQLLNPSIAGPKSGLVLPQCLFGALAVGHVATNRLVLDDPTLLVKEAAVAPLLPVELAVRSQDLVFPGRDWALGR